MRRHWRQNVVGVSIYALSRTTKYPQGSDNGGKRLSVVCEERFVLLAAKLDVTGRCCE